MIAKILPKKSGKFTYELGYIIGVLYGDGSRWKCEHRGLFELRAIDRCFVEKFANCIMKQFGHSNESVKIKKFKKEDCVKNGKRYKCRPQYRFGYNHVNASRFVNNLLRRYDFTDKSTCFKKGLIEGLYESEGSLSIANGLMSFSNSNPKILRLFRRLILSELNIKSVSYYRNGFGEVRFSGIKKLVMFHEGLNLCLHKSLKLIGFIKSFRDRHAGIYESYIRAMELRDVYGVSSIKIHEMLKSEGMDVPIPSIENWIYHDVEPYMMRMI